MTLQLEYETQIGLTPAQARLLVNKYSGNPAVLLECSKIQPFHDRTVTLYSEELPFLRICRKDSPQEEKSDQPIIHREVFPKERLQWNRRVSLLRIRHAVYSPDGKPGAKWVLYHENQQCVLILEDSLKKMLEGFPCHVNFSLKNVADDVEKNMIQSLLNYGFLKEPVMNRSPVFNWEKMLLRFDPNTVCQVDDGERDEVFLFQYSYGCILKMPKASLSLLQGFRNPVSADFVYSRLIENGSLLTQKVFQHFLETCLKNKVLGIVDGEQKKGGESYAGISETTDCYNSAAG